MRMNHADIARHIPHQGRMCLLEGVEQYDDACIVCVTQSHVQPDNPLRHEGVLGAALGVEYAAQAMALHCALLAGDAPRASSGYLTSVRALELHAAVLDEAPLPLRIEAQRLACNEQTAMYHFAIHAGDRLLLQGRLSAVMDAGALASTSSV